MHDTVDPLTLNTATRGHHPDSPSSLQSSAACSSFENEQRDTQASRDGTLQHKATETRDVSILGGNESWVAAVELCIAYEDAAIDVFTDAGLTFEVIREQYLAVGEEVVGTDLENVNAEFYTWFRGVTGGFPDTLIVGARHAVLLDWKFGRVPVTPTRDNLQGIAYALGAFQLYPELETVQVDFFAPHQKWSDAHQIAEYVHTFHRTEIPVLELRIRTVVARKHVAYAAVARDDWSHATPKTDLCLWCSRKGLCPKVGSLLPAVVEKYHDLVVPDEVKEYRLTRPEQVAVAYRFASQFDLIIKAIKARCIEASLTEDLKPEGFTIVKQQKRSVKKIGVLLNIAAEHGLPRETALELLSAPLGEFEDAIKATAAKGQGAARVRAFASELSECGATELGKPIYFLREVKTPAEKPNQQVIEV